MESQKHTIDIPTVLYINILRLCLQHRDRWTRQNYVRFLKMTSESASLSLSLSLSLSHQKLWSPRMQLRATIAVASPRVRRATIGGREKRVCLWEQTRGSSRKILHQLVFWGSDCDRTSHVVPGHDDDHAMQMSEGRTAAAANRTYRPSEATCNNNHPTHGAHGAIA